MATRGFGSIARWIDNLAGDLRYGLRAFRRSPGFAVTAVVSLAGSSRRKLPGVSPIDAQIVTVCATIMVTLAAAAVSVPAIRACRIDPLTALRRE